MAIEAFYAAEQHGADADRCAGGRWHCWMLKGNFHQAWKESDAIRHRGAPDPNRFWNGDDFTGKRVIVRCLHGYGDAIQMLRYAPVLRQRARYLTLEVPPQLYGLAQCFPAVDDVVYWSDISPWEVQMEVMELPYIFRASTTTVPLQIPCLALPHSAVADARMRIATRNKPRIGIFWMGGRWNPSRSLPFSALRPLLRTEGLSFWSLQRTHENLAWNDFWLSRNARPNTCAEGLLSLAAMIQQMDLVITIDSIAAHLAGALSTPVWTLLPRYADWRWMLHRSSSPWYPTMRLVPADTRGPVGRCHCFRCGPPGAMEGQLALNVSTVISGGQFRRNGIPTVPIPRFT
jgi:hypothetical protein